MSLRALAEAEEDAATPDIDAAALANGAGAPWLTFFVLRLSQAFVREFRIRRRLRARRDGER